MLVAMQFFYHAEQRLRQRGIRDHQVTLVLKYGQVYDAGPAAKAFYVTRELHRELHRLQNHYGDTQAEPESSQ